MNPELLTCRRLIVSVVYQPKPIQPTDFNRVYAEITERYPYQTLQHLPDGVRMANPTSDCFVQVGRMQVSEEVLYFQVSKQKCLDIFEIISTRLRLQQFLMYGIKLISFLPIYSSDAAEFMESQVFGIERGSWDVLGPGRSGAGLRVILHQNGIRDLRIEPFFNDPAELYVELDSQHHEPLKSLDQLAQQMDSAYDYVFNNVKQFLGTLNSRHPELR